jgi:hypothetical protein
MRRYATRKDENFQQEVLDLEKNNDSSFSSSSSLTSSSEESSD